jgi:hypothetical protein
VSMPFRSVPSWIQVSIYHEPSSWSSIIDCIPDRAPSLPIFYMFLCAFMLTKSLRNVLCVFVCVEKDHFACVRILFSMCFSSWVFVNYLLYFDAISSHEFWTRVPWLKLSWNVISSFALCYTGFIFSPRNKNSDLCWMQLSGFWQFVLLAIPASSHDDYAAAQRVEIVASQMYIAVLEATCNLLFGLKYDFGLRFLCFTKGVCMQ